ncbi:UNVERIFIED_CONTAM: hypothetical protein FKN15_059294 [Acipenser sinensis]
MATNFKFSSEESDEFPPGQVQRSVRPSLLHRLQPLPERSPEQRTAVRRTRQAVTQPQIKTLFYKDWTQPGLLKVLFDQAIPIPTRGDREELFQLYCSTTSATPVFPPVKRKRNVSQSRRPGLPIAVPIYFQLQALDLPVYSDPPHQVRHQSQTNASISPAHSTHLPPQAASDPDTFRISIMQDMKALLQPITDSMRDMNARLGSLEARSSPAPLPVLTTSSSIIEVIDLTPSFTLSSAAPVNPQQSFGSRRITVSPALRKQIIEGPSTFLPLLVGRVPTCQAGPRQGGFSIFVSPTRTRDSLS